MGQSVEPLNSPLAEEAAEAAEAALAPSALVPLAVAALELEVLTEKQGVKEAVGKPHRRCSTRCICAHSRPPLSPCLC